MDYSKEARAERLARYDRVHEGAGINAVSYPLQVALKIADYFKEVMLPNERFVFDEPCGRQVEGHYNIYSICNVNGMIMAEFVRNGSKNGEHEISTKGLESPYALLEAMTKYFLNQGTSEIHPEYEKAEKVWCV